MYDEDIRQDLNLDYLNENQKYAVEFFGRPLLVLAGAGTGKTAAITHKIAYMIKNNIALPHEILSVTFTNKAASEMQERVFKLTNKNVPWLGTFHRVALKILREHASVIDFSNSFNIISSDDQMKLVKSICDELFGVDAVNYKNILYIIERWKDQGLFPEMIGPELLTQQTSKYAKQVYVLYQKRLFELSAADFSDLLLYNVKIFESQPQILQYYRDLFKYILVDEYQDTNLLQLKWLQLLAEDGHNLCCVGDEDQSIYRWRGAEIENILRFQDVFKNPEVVRLEQNYRSTSTILTAASHLISKNEERFGKTLWTTGAAGEKIWLVSAYNDKQEADFVINTILEHVKNSKKYLDHAILVRANFQTRSFEESFVFHSVPYKIIGGLKFYERKEIKDIIAYIRLSLNNDDDLAFDRIINVPRRGIGDVTIGHISNYARHNECSYYAAAKALIASSTFPSRVSKIIEGFLLQIEDFGLLFQKEPAHKVLESIIERSGYAAMISDDDTMTKNEKINKQENIKELLRVVEDAETIHHFLDYIALVQSDNPTGEESDNNVVKVMTLHAAKGLEFPIVFLPGWEEGVFPSGRARDEGVKALQEERRLAYVGITRAKERLYISFATNRKMYGSWQYNSPSSFIKDLPEHCIYKTAFTIAQNSNAEVSNIVLNNQKKDNQKLVLHRVFGIGKLMKADSNICIVDFEKHGIKRIAKNFLEEL